MEETKRIRLFLISISYFKETGKHYTSCEVEWPCEDVGPDGHPLCNMHEVLDRVRELRRQNKLPGLQSGSWLDDFILVDCEHGFPCLITPAWATMHRRKLASQKGLEYTSD